MASSSGRTCEIPSVGKYIDADGVAQDCSDITEAAFAENTGPVSHPNECAFSCTTGRKVLVVDIEEGGSTVLVPARLCLGPRQGLWDDNPTDEILQNPADLLNINPVGSPLQGPYLPPMFVITLVRWATSKERWIRMVQMQIVMWTGNARPPKRESMFRAMEQPRGIALLPLPMELYPSGWFSRDLCRYLSFCL